MSPDAADAACVVTVTPDGLDPDVWAATLDDVPEWDPISVGAGTLLVLSAHPDDETIGFGASISRWARTTGPVDLVCLTAGEACLDGAARTRSMVSAGPSRAAIGDLRRDEYSRAGTALGARSTRCRDLPDSALSEMPGRLTAEIQRAVVRSRPVLIAAPWAEDPHPDHMTLGRATTEVAARHAIPVVEYPVWASFRQPPPDDPPTAARLVLLPTTAVDDQRREAAIGCYPSQYSSFFAGLGPVVPDALLEHHRRPFAFRPRESAERP